MRAINGVGLGEGGLEKIGAQADGAADFSNMHPGGESDARRHPAQKHTQTHTQTSTRGIRTVGGSSQTDHLMRNTAMDDSIGGS